MKIYVAILGFTFFSPLAVFAASGVDHGEAHIPWGMIGQQVFNLSIVVFGLWYLLRKKVATHFSERKENFNHLIQKAEEAKVSAEKSKREILDRLNNLESQAQNSIEEAQSEAEELKAKILKEANALANRLEEDAAKSAEYEVERAKLQLRNELLKNSIAQSKQTLNSQIDESEQKVLNQQFIQKLQVTQ